MHHLSHVLSPLRYTPPSGTDTANLQTIVQRDQNRIYNWSYLRPMRNSTANVMLYGVPYSEHRCVLSAHEGWQLIDRQFLF
jgi:DNA cross-link repair 1A protein